jgi:putative ABC transport system substrate-binding protein
MRRREFIGLVCSAALAGPAGVHAQQVGKVPRVGFFGPDRATSVQAGYYQAFVAQLEKNGFQEGQNIVVEYRAIDDPRGPFVSAAELLRGQPDLIVAAGPEVALQAVVGASGYIPIVMFAVNFDPIERGYVTNLAQPGGNITGVVVRPVELARKQIDLLRQTFPDRNRLAILYDALTADQFAAANQSAKSHFRLRQRAERSWRCYCRVPRSPNVTWRSQSLRLSTACPPCSPSSITSTVGV